LTAAILCSISEAQNSPQSEQQEYQAAVSKPTGPEQFSALEKFITAHPQSRLKLDALEMLVWDARTSAGVADLEYWTGQLLSIAPDNPLAAAVIIGNSLNISSENPVSLAKRSLPALDRFDRPEGLSHDDFTTIKDFASATLNGVVGYSYFEQKDLVSARPYLRKAVELNPSNAQYTYTLALSDLQGSNPDQAEGYKMLARAVNLTKGTPAGERLAAFARQNFQQAGGSSENWDKYLAATAMPAPSGVESAAVSAANPAATQPAATGSTQPSTSALASATKPSPPAAETREPIFIASNGPVPSVGVRSATPPLPAAAPEPDRPMTAFPPRPARHIVPGSPVSVGVLIQASLTNRIDRRPVVFTLSDLVRHLRDKDEAFIMSFSRGVVFQEDLTSNSKSLENAMDSIAPTPGAAMYDAVTFAAGHLDRVARNKNRILLVVAAEGDRDSTVSPLELSSEINLSGVTIYCIGVGVVTPNDRSRLESLADSTGGRAIFIPDLSGFRQATRTIAQGIGLSFPN
jgi:tetratricopeptide (TPR) repeat protein